MPKVTVAMDQFAPCLSQVSSGVYPCSCCVALGSSLHVCAGLLLGTGVLVDDGRPLSRVHLMDWLRQSLWVAGFQGNFQASAFA